MSIREDLAIRLIEERARLGFSQSDLARQLEISTETLRRYEVGAREMGAEVLAKSAGLGLDVQYILTGVHSQNLEFAEKANQPLVHIESGATGNIVNQVQNGGTVNIANRHITQVKAEVKPNETHISQEQASCLKKLVDDIVELELRVKQKPKTHQAVWSALNAHCRVTRYLLIPYESYDKAEKYLRMWIGRLNNTKKAQTTDNSEWRQRKYSYIKINTKDEPDWLHTYINSRFDADSISELTNEQLEQTYRAVASKRSRNGKVGTKNIPKDEPRLKFVE